MTNFLNVSTICNFVLPSFPPVIFLNTRLKPR